MRSAVQDKVITRTVVALHDNEWPFQPLPRRIGPICLRGGDAGAFQRTQHIELEPAIGLEDAADGITAKDEFPLHRPFAFMPESVEGPVLARQPCPHAPQTLDTQIAGPRDLLPQEADQPLLDPLRHGHRSIAWWRGV